MNREKVNGKNQRNLQKNKYTTVIYYLKDSSFEPLSRYEASLISLKLSMWEWRDIRRRMSTSPSCVALQTKPMHDGLARFDGAAAAAA